MATKRGRTNTSPNKPQGTRVVAVSPSLGTPKRTFSAEHLAALSIVIAVLSAIFSAWAAYETRESRLDATRSRLKAETIQALAEMRLSFSIFNCYGSVKGIDFAERPKIEALIATMEPKIREGLSNLPKWGPDALAVYERSLNGSSGSSSSQLKDLLLKVRARWNKEELERVDAVCKI